MKTVQEIVEQIAETCLNDGYDLAGAPYTGFDKDKCAEIIRKVRDEARTETLDQVLRLRNGVATWSARRAK